MSYRTTVNGYQIFGNNECYLDWIKFIQSQGIKVDLDNNYEGEITDVMGALIAIEKIIDKIETERCKQILEFKKSYKVYNERIDEIAPRSIFDLRPQYYAFIKQRNTMPDDEYNNSITDRMLDVYENGYAFLSCAFLTACKDDIERDHAFTVPGHFNCYKIKKDHTIKVKAN